MKNMEDNNIWIWAAAILGVIAGGWLIKRIVTPPTPLVEEEFADGEIAFDDMVGYFKSLHLKKKMEYAL